ncbi:MAG: hypothetical protein NTU98_11460 [Bacteroidetes bacterium]|nr:hypothetical protein [Bacteroidota bacterium]
MKYRYLFISLFIILFATSCNWRSDRLKVDVSKISVPDVKIHRYDVDLFKIRIPDLQNGLEAIKNEYYFFLGTNLGDPKKLDEMSAYLENPRNIDFHQACVNQYKDLSDVEKGLTETFRHLRYYFPDAKIPRVYSYISGGDYPNSVQLADSVMIIALDNYLGKDFKPYFTDGLPAYKAERMTKHHIVPDCAAAIISSLYPENPASMTLLDAMVDAGKRLYLVEAMIPEVPGYLKMDYTEEQYEWAQKNEAHVWAAIIENRMLYSTDGQYFRMFLSDGPCTMEFTKDSPPRLGEWIGVQIIRAWMQNNPGITLQQMMQEKDSQKVLSKSGYKPKK